VTQGQVDLVQRTCGRLLALDPRLKKLFRDDPVEQGRNLTAMLSVAVGSLHRPEKIAYALKQLGRGEGGVARGLRLPFTHNARRRGREPYSAIDAGDDERVKRSRYLSRAFS
jgi:hypothetical protein